MEKTELPTPPQFLSDAEIGRRLGIAEGEWPRVRTAFERDGLPRKDPVANKRYWPAIERWLLARYGFSDSVYVPPDGKDNFP